MASRKEIFIARWRTAEGVRSCQFRTRAEAQEFIDHKATLGFETWLMTIGLRGDISDQDMMFLIERAVRHADEMEGTGNAP